MSNLANETLKAWAAAYDQAIAAGDYTRAAIAHSRYLRALSLS